MKLLKTISKMLRWVISTEKNSCLILSPSWEGSLGDEALVAGLSLHFKEKYQGKVGMLCWDSHDPWMHLDSIDMRYAFPRLIEGLFFDLLQIVFLMLKYEYFYVVGADVLDGRYNKPKSLMMIKIGELAQTLRRKVTFVGFSISATPDQECLQFLARLPEEVKLFLRDGTSLQRLRQVCSRPLELSADLAFLLPPKHDTSTVAKAQAWLQQQKTAGRLCIGVNFNKKLISNATTSEDYEKAIYNFAQELIGFYQDSEQPVSFLFLPHDFRRQIRDDFFCAAVMQHFPSSMQSHCYLFPPPYNASEVKAIVGELCFVITGRMHVAIAALGRGVPIFCLVYQGKFAGLFAHFGMNEHGFSPEDLPAQGKLRKILLASFAQRSQQQQQIVAKLPEVIELARKNLTGFTS